ncbi:hypothetical protein [Schnuerera ultunensis]|uniref:DUF3800 domain-containing protein n=1 Tax=[Clostridium] ultunense Esp TaxID=1288971 RepID=A0A1M4PPX0_9FIRM|nr:hypothetical protein [Schnuerera ultunensis]SHD77513.1 conserved protein of unknown function [[Clostridium] ultunense Esp]
MNKKENLYLDLYCDEVKDCRLEIKSTGEIQSWTYIGILIVPDYISTELFTDINNLRCLSDSNQNWESCQKNCKYHERNDTEIHYNKVGSTIKYKIASRWVDYWLNDKNLIYYYILGIDTNKLDKQNFGPKEQQDRNTTIYNRFFRAALQSSLNWYFGKDKNIIVKNIYHDKGNSEEHQFFPWHPIYKTEREYDNIKFQNTTISFIDSDHRKATGHPYHSHFIQFIDIILGCYVNCLHKNSINENKLNLAIKSFDIIERIVKNPFNKNSKYNYYKRQSIQFFPKHDLIGLDENSLEYQKKRKDNYYYNRPLLIEQEATGQLSFLDDMLSL